MNFQASASISFRTTNAICRSQFMMPGPKRTQEGVKLVALQPKPKRGKKAAVVEKTTEQKTEKERTYHQWTPDENSILVEWFENPENYARWKFSGKTNKASGRLNTTPVTRASLEREIHQYMSSKDVARDLTSVIGKIKSIENSWKKAHDELVKQTGSGIDDLNERMQAADIRGNENLLLIRGWFQIIVNFT